MIWTQSNCLITGCSKGQLSHWSQDFEYVTQIKLHVGEIINIKLSCLENNLVTSGVDKKIKNLIWPSKIPGLELQCETPVKVGFYKIVVLTYAIWYEYWLFYTKNIKHINPFLT